MSAVGRREVLDAVRSGRVIWCGSCSRVRLLRADQLADKAEIMRRDECERCHAVDWIRMTVEKITSDPKFWSLDEPD